MAQLLRNTRLIAELLASRLGGQRGATAVEYGVMVALIAAVIIGAVVALGNNASTTFCNTAKSLQSGTTC